MSKKYAITFWVVTFGFALAYAFIQDRREESRLDDLILQDGGQVSELPILGESPKFSLNSSDDVVITNESLLGKMWVLKLFYGTCEYPCLRMSHNFSRLQSFFTKGDHVRLLSVSIDPQNDTKETLNKYRKDYHGNSNIWKFLMGNEQSLQEFADGFKLPLDIQKKTHSKRFVLVDSEGKIRGYYDSLKKSSMELLRSNLTQLIVKKKSSKEKTE